MRGNYNTSLKPKKYVYTEKDLGEGLLEEGVSHAYFVDINRTTNNNVNSSQVKNNSLLRDCINVQEDFTYVYYS